MIRFFFHPSNACNFFKIKNRSNELTERIDELERGNFLMRARAEAATASEEKMKALQIQIHQMVQEQNRIAADRPFDHEQQPQCGCSIM